MNLRCRLKRLDKLSAGLAADRARPLSILEVTVQNREELDRVHERLGYNAAFGPASRLLPIDLPAGTTGITTAVLLELLPVAGAMPATTQSRSRR